MTIGYYNQDCNYKLHSRRKISQWIKDTVAAEGFQGIDNLSIVLCSDEHLLGINRQYLQHDYYTDIITFDETDYEELIISGDIMISIDTVKANAKEYGVSTWNELMRIIIHGVLHLCGYKDKEEEEEKVMHQREDFYLEQAEKLELL